jgi:hypothetical protein
MRVFILTSSLLINSVPAQATPSSSCHNDCFEAKQSCNLKKAYTVNACDHDLVACKHSCVGGKPQEFYRKSPAFDITLNSMVDLEKHS